MPIGFFFLYFSTLIRLLFIYRIHTHYNLESLKKKLLILSMREMNNKGSGTQVGRRGNNTVLTFTLNYLSPIVSLLLSFPVIVNGLIID